MGARPLDVLIVEDEVLLATELEFLLREVGCRTVGLALNSDEAVVMAETVPPVGLQLAPAYAARWRVDDPSRAG